MKNLTLSLLAIIFATVSNAQTTDNLTQTVTLTLQNQIEISVVSASGTTFTFASTSDYASGLTNTAASQFQVSSNRPWAVTVAAAAANFTSAASTTMPASKLGIKLNGGQDAFANLSTSAVSFTSGSRGTSTFSVDYNANPGFDYDAGTYTLGVVYTATQQ